MSSHLAPPGAPGTARPVALVTGAAQGIGWACARALAAQDWSVALLDLDGAVATQRAAELGPEHLGLACDVTQAEAVEAAVQAALARFGRLDGLVNNAGIGDQTGPTVAQSAAAFDRVLAVHLRGSFLMSQALGRHWLAKPASASASTNPGRGQRGAIVNLASIASLGGLPTRNAYSAAKAGVLGLTRALACEWARAGIRVNAVAPGTIATELAAQSVLTSDEARRRIMSRTPLKRLGTPDEMADVVAWLASDASSYVTGEIVVADGGRMTLNYTVAA